MALQLQIFISMNMYQTIGSSDHKYNKHPNIIHIKIEILLGKF